MSQDDPFSALDSDKTLILPRPGGRPVKRVADAPAAAGPTGYEADVAESHETAISGLNPLIAAANPLLNLVPQLRGSLQHSDPAGLREHLANRIRAFESRAKAAGVSPEKVVAGRYVLCTFLDETASSTPWGGSGMWAKHSLLVTFHNETWGGEKFFQLMGKLAENPAQNRDLLELMYVCLSLGFEGRYRVVEGGKAQLDGLRERLLQILRQQMGDYERALSPRWQGATVKSHPMLGFMPLWVFGAVLGVFLLGLFLVFSYRLNQKSDPVFSEIIALRAKLASPAPSAPTKPRLAKLLESEVAAGLMEVRDEQDRSVVTLSGSNMFAAGSDELSDQYRSLILLVGQALDTLPGAIVVTGHTDNVPTRTIRFPSNWHLSRARAESVMALLAGKLKRSDRLSAEGHAEAEPLAPNDTPANRARNRRVEITLFAAANKTVQQVRP